MGNKNEIVKKKVTVVVRHVGWPRTSHRVQVTYRPCTYPEANAEDMIRRKVSQMRYKRMTEIEERYYRLALEQDRLNVERVAAYLKITDRITVPCPIIECKDAAGEPMLIQVGASK